MNHAEHRRDAESGLVLAPDALACGTLASCHDRDAPGGAGSRWAHVDAPGAPGTTPARQVPVTPVSDAGAPADEAGPPPEAWWIALASLGGQ